MDHGSYEFNLANLEAANGILGSQRDNARKEVKQLERKCKWLLTGNIVFCIVVTFIAWKYM